MAKESAILKSTRFSFNNFVRKASALANYSAVFMGFGILVKNILKKSCNSNNLDSKRALFFSVE
ncbi:hypothetical protein [Helicobacter sp. MIT 99-5507]|uniref:hypothetical protein n=1 Tax=Helicobacter sp. MIT 99-5507 TaxID=152489 RepID=UPI000E1F130B|nr:hypothetical protein [Helicobacter sp. MIT 99-5507]RDU58555.1 hypothetical protein CQA42_01850 [Helicobacter sp. MIT 99-5507]